MKKIEILITFFLLSIYFNSYSQIPAVSKKIQLDSINKKKNITIKSIPENFSKLPKNTETKFTDNLWNTIIPSLIIALITFLGKEFFLSPFKKFKLFLLKAFQKKGTVKEDSPNLKFNSLEIIESNFIKYEDNFIGRESELYELHKLIFFDKKRLITIFGPGGIGKTRLSHCFGTNHFKELKDGIVFVDLIQAKTLVGIVEEVMKSFKQTNASLQIAPQDIVLEYLKDKKDLIIILDNFEQVEGYFKETVEYWIRNLNNGIRFIITSRNKLNSHYETTIELDSIDENNQLEKSKLLFIERAKKVLKLNEIEKLIIDTDSLNNICAKLDGIPLAIEIVSAQTRTKSLLQISQELNDYLRFTSKTVINDKHHTLYDTINWSYNLLNTDEKMVFLQLAIFRDGCDLKAYKNIIITKDLNNEDILNRLIDKSLVKVLRTEYFPRFIMYVPIYQFAKEKLNISKNEIQYRDLFSRWSSYYIQYIENHNKKINTESTKKSMDLIELEIENIFEIHEKSLELAKPSISAKAVLSIMSVLEVRGPSQMRLPIIEKTLIAYGNEQNELVLFLKIEKSKAYWASGMWDPNLSLLFECIPLANKLSLVKELSLIYKEIGKTFNDRGYHKNALRVLTHGYKIFKDNNLSEKSIEIQYLIHIATSYEKSDDLKSCINYLDKANNIAIEISNKTDISLIHNKKSLAYWHYGNMELGLIEINKASEYGEVIKNNTWRPAHLTNRGLVLTDAGKYQEALECFREAGLLHNKLGYKHWAAVNEGGFGRALMMQNKVENLSLAREFCLKALEISEKIFYPENMTMHFGDLARIDFYENKFFESYTKSKKTLALALKIGTIKTTRHFSNLVVYYISCLKLKKISEAYEAKHMIDEMMNLEFVMDKGIPKIEEDLELLKQYNFDFSNCPDEILFLNQTQSQVMKVLNKNIGALNYEYPWYDLENELLAKECKSIKLFTYGSLINKKSAQKTLTDEVINQSKSAIAVGLKRIFNYNMPEEVSKRQMYQTEINPNEYSVLNTEFTGLSSDYCNGLIIEIPIEEINYLRSREIGYDLVSIKCFYWETQMWETELVFSLSCEHKLFKDKWLTNDGLTPHPNYLKVCQEGAKSIGEDFYEMWLKTTFLSNGIDSIK